MMKPGPEYCPRASFAFFPLFSGELSGHLLFLKRSNALCKPHKNCPRFDSQCHHKQVTVFLLCSEVWRLLFRDKFWFSQRCQPTWPFVSWPPLTYAVILDFPWIPGKEKREKEYQTMSSCVRSSTFPSPQTPALMSSALASAHGHMCLQGWLGNWGGLWHSVVGMDEREKFWKCVCMSRCLHLRTCVISRLFLLERLYWI